MKYPKAVQPYADVLTKYAENNELKLFHILHMYPGKLAYKNGYYDSKFFELIGYNTETMEFKNLGRHDELSFRDQNIQTDFVRIFVDGSTMIRFLEAVEINSTSGNAYIFPQ